MSERPTDRRQLGVWMPGQVRDRIHVAHAHPRRESLQESIRRVRGISKPYGVTLVEVIFAIGVVLIGLVGLVSVMPIAARRAQDAIDLNEASALASAVFDELKAKGALRKSAWVVRNDIGSPSPGTLQSAHAALFQDVTAWCIDPMFVSADVSRLDDASGGYYSSYDPGDPASGNGYRRMLFPYFRREHDPLADPSVRPDEFWFPTGPPLGAIGPRMLRVGIMRQQGGLLLAREAEALVESLDEVATSKSEDRTLSVVSQTDRASATGSPLGKRLTDGSLTWIATCNQLPDSNYMSVSIVVIRNRDRSFFTYPATLSNNNTPASTAEGNATAERLAYVSEAYGFTGGAGGTVKIWGAAEDDQAAAPTGGVSPQIVGNDWVMLSRQIFAPGSVAGATPVGTIHRWFRVVSVDQEPTFRTQADPVHGDPHEIWERTLYLAGPDWSFGFGTPHGVRDDTYATIVDDVVAVSEHMIRVQ